MGAASTAIYTLSLHDALPICGEARQVGDPEHQEPRARPAAPELRPEPRLHAAVAVAARVEVRVPLDGHERSEEHTSELQSLRHLVCRLLLEKTKKNKIIILSL